MQKEETIQAVVIADTYNNVFYPITKTRPMALFPLVGVPLIDIALDSLALAGVQETILFTCKFVSILKKHISEAIKNKAVWSITMDVQVVASDTCHTMGDAMRELYDKGLIRGYFILTGVNTISNVPLLPLLEQHKQLCKKDKNAAMTLVYKKAAWGHQLTSADSAVILATDGNTGQILSHKKIKHADLKLNKNISVPVEIMLSHPEVVFHHSLVDTNMAICSPSVLPLFADNFDFQSRDDFVKGILMNEEVLESTLYWTTLKGKEYAACISNWQSYQTISRDVLHHWVFPLTINNLSPSKQQRYLLYGDHILKNKNVSLGRNCFLEEDVIIREACIIGENTNITRSFIGDNCQIASNVSISNSHILAGVIIMDNCKISDSFIGEDCIINENCIITEGTILAPKITLDVNSELRGHVALSKDTADENRSKTSAENTEWDNESNKSDDEAELIGFSKRIIESDCDYSSSSDEELSTIESPTPDDTNIFLQEVIDSLARGYEEKLNCDYLILEINSSRYAYNMQLGEVNFYVVRAILSLPILAESTMIATALKDVMRFFLPIFKNYIKSKDSIMESLNAIEESCLKCSWLDSKAGFIIHFLYEHDITDEDSIVDWYESLTMKGSEIGKQTSLIKFIQWLQQASEESEESE